MATLKRACKTGFTLLELLIVVAIIFILAVIVVAVIWCLMTSRAPSDGEIIEISLQSTADYCGAFSVPNEHDSTQLDHNFVVRAFW